MVPLWRLCTEGDLEGVKEALGGREGVNGRGDDGILSSPPMWAAGKKHNSIVEVLLCQPGVDMNCQATWGQAALQQCY